MYKNLLLTLALFCFVISKAQKSFLFAGTYTDGKPDTGIFVYQFDTQNGKLSDVSNVPGLVNPSFLTISPNGKYLYACTDTRMPAGSITAFSIDSTTGVLSMLNKQPSGGANPVYVSVDQANTTVITTNYNDGKVAAFKIEHDGSLGPIAQYITFKDSSVHKQRQEASHVHAAVFSPNKEFVLIPDLGADKIRIFKFQPDSNTIMKESGFASSPPGSGPRHLIFHPNGNFFFCIEELSGTISVYTYGDGIPGSLQRIFANSKNHAEYSGADIHISPDGKFLYASNRGKEENTIAIFRIEENGLLKLIGHQSTLGDTPRNFTLDPSGSYLLVANQASNNIIVFKRDLETGLLTKTDEVRIRQPACLKMRGYAE